MGLCNGFMATTFNTAFSWRLKLPGLSNFACWSPPPNWAPSCQYLWPSPHVKVTRKGKTALSDRVQTLYACYLTWTRSWIKCSLWHIYNRLMFPDWFVFFLVAFSQRLLRDRKGLTSIRPTLDLFKEMKDKKTLRRFPRNWMERTLAFASMSWPS